MLIKLSYICFLIAAIVPQVFPQSKDEKGGLFRRLAERLTPNPAATVRTYCNPLNIAD